MAVLDIQLSQTRERLYWNVIRGIAIFLMLWGHCVQFCALDSFPIFDNRVFLIIYSFHMPLFAFVSGFLFFYSFEKRELKELLIHRAGSLLWPITSGTVMHNLLMIIPALIMSPGKQPALFNGELLQGWTGLTWFLWSMLACGIAVGIAGKLGTTSLRRSVYLALGCILIAMFPNANESLFLYPFFLIGFLCAKHKLVLRSALQKVKYGFLLLFPGLAVFYQAEHLIYITPIRVTDGAFSFALGLNLYRFSVGLAGIGCCLVLVELVFRWCVKDRRTPKLLNALSQLGENSLAIYCLSIPLLSGYLPLIFRKCMEPFGYNLLAENWVIYNLIFTPILAAVYGAGLLAVVKLLRKAGIHTLIFGR